MKDGEIVAELRRPTSVAMLHAIMVGRPSTRNTTASRARSRSGRDRPGSGGLGGKAYRNVVSSFAAAKSWASPASLARAARS